MSPDAAAGARRILRNTAWSAASELAARALGFLAVVCLAARLDTHGFGQLGFAQAFLACFLFLSEFGVKTVGTRDLARDRGHVRDAVVPYVLSRLVLLGLTGLMLAVLWVALPKPAAVKELIVLYWLSLLPAVFLPDWVYLALEEMALPALANLLRAAIYLGLILLWVSGPQDLLAVGIANLVGAAAATLALGWAFVARHRMPRLHLGSPLGIIASAIPLGAGAVMVQVYYNLDTILLGFMKTDREVGLFTAAFKIVLTLYAVGGSFAQMAFPALARAFQHDAGHALRLYRFAVRVTLLVALPVAIGGALMSHDILRLVYSTRYAAAAGALSIFMLTFFFMLTGALCGGAVLAFNGQRPYLGVVTAGALFNAAANLTLIPRFGIEGAAAAHLLTEILVFAGMQASLPADYRRVVLAAAWRPALAALAMGGVVMALRRFGPLPAFAGGVVVYLPLALLTGALRREDWHRLRKP